MQDHSTSVNVNPENDEDTISVCDPQDPTQALGQAMLLILMMCEPKNQSTHEEIQEVAKQALQAVDVNQTEAVESARRLLHRDLSKTQHDPDAKLSEGIELTALILAKEHDIEEWPVSKVSQTIEALGLLRRVALTKESTTAH